MPAEGERRCELAHAAMEFLRGQLGQNLDKGFPRLSLAAVEANGLALKHLAPEMQARNCLRGLKTA